jgi:hypothetical protein
MTIARPIPKMEIKDVVRFINNIDFSKGCWNFIKGRKNKFGHCEFHFNGKSYPAHRVSYEFFTRDIIPLDYAIDHLCKNPSCVNPAHLEPVTHSENSRRGNGISSIHRRKDCCVRGHKFTPENTRLRRSRVDGSMTWRICRKCTGDYMKEYVAKKKLGT